MMLRNRTRRRLLDEEKDTANADPADDPQRMVTRQDRAMTQQAATQRAAAAVLRARQRATAANNVVTMTAGPSRDRRVTYGPAKVTGAPEDENGHLSPESIAIVGRYAPAGAETLGEYVEDTDESDEDATESEHEAQDFLTAREDIWGGGAK